MAETPLRNIRVKDPLWSDAILVTHELGTTATAVCTKALTELVESNPNALRRAKRKARTRQQQ